MRHKSGPRGRRNSRGDDDASVHVGNPADDAPCEALHEAALEGRAERVAQSKAEQAPLESIPGCHWADQDSAWGDPAAERPGAHAGYRTFPTVANP